MARHLAPFSCRQTRAESVRRRSWGGVLPLGRHASTNGSSRPHCVSVSIAPPHLGRSKKCYPREEVQGRTGPNITVVCAFCGVRFVRRLDACAPKPTTPG